MNLKTRALSIIFTLSAIASTYAASSGSLDLGFGTAGVTIKNLGVARQEAKAVAIQADGKMVLVGAVGTFVPVYNLDFLLIRYNTDGSIDTDFGTGGVVTTDFNGENEEAAEVAILPDGKILVAGSRAGFGGGPTAFKLARYLPNGSLDETFGNGGKVRSGFLEYEARVYSMIVLPDGKIVVAGEDGNPNLLLTRFHANGSVDTDFGTGGQVIITPGGLTFPALGRQSDGKLIVAGLSFNATDSVTVYRLNANGSVDTSFGTGGKTTKTYTAFNLLFRIVGTNLAVLPDDKILIGGTFNSSWQSEHRQSIPPLIKLNADGSFDPSFIPNANVTGPTEDCSLCTSMVSRILPTADGKFYVVGRSGFWSAFFHTLSVSRYLADGSLDRSFGLRGNRLIRKVDLPNSVRGAALQPDGKIVIGATGSTTWLDQSETSNKILALRLNPNVTPETDRGDFDGDGKTDFVVFRPSDRFWYRLNSGDGSFTPTFFGVSTDTVAPGDYNYDGKTDHAVFRSSNATWWVQPSAPGGGLFSGPFGTAGDTPVNADYDGDGLTDLAIFQPSGTWRLRYSSATLTSPYVVTVAFGLAADKPVPADYDGDGISDVAVFRPSTGVWWILRSSDGQVSATAWGLSGDKPAQGDYDGDGKTDIAVYREGVWYALKSSDGSAAILQWGLAGDTPVPGDYDGDNKTDFAVFRPSEGNWYVFKSADASYIILHWGQDGDVPIPARYLPK